MQHSESSQISKFLRFKTIWSSSFEKTASNLIYCRFNPIHCGIDGGINTWFSRLSTIIAPWGQAIDGQPTVIIVTNKWSSRIAATGRVVKMAYPGYGKIFMNFWNFHAISKKLRFGIKLSNFEIFKKIFKK